MSKQTNKPNHKKGDNMATKQSTQTALTKPSSFRALATSDAASMSQLIAENFDGITITPNDLEVIKVPSGGQSAFEVEENGETQYVKEFSGIILGVRVARTMWLKGLNDKDNNSGTPPDCFSPDGITGKGDPGGPCNKCGLSEFGSADDGNGQKCKEMKLIALLRPNSLLPTIVRVPPTSLKNVSQYIRILTQTGKRRIGVITTFSLKEATSRSGIKYAQIVLSTKNEQHLEDREIELAQNFAKTMKGVIDGFGRSADHFIPSQEEATQESAD
jgi:hypothetical protein